MAFPTNEGIIPQGKTNVKQKIEGNFHITGSNKMPNIFLFYSFNIPEFENRRKREIAEKEKSRAKRAGKKQKRMHESKDLSKNRAINLIFLQKSVDKREDILYN